MATERPEPRVDVISDPSAVLHARAEWAAQNESANAGRLEGYLRVLGRANLADRRLLRDFERQRGRWIPTFEEAAIDPDPARRAAALLLLARLGAAGVDDRLVALLEEPESLVPGLAVIARDPSLVLGSASAGRVQPVVRRAARSNDPLVRTAAMRAAAALKCLPADEATIDAVLELAAASVGGDSAWCDDALRTVVVSGSPLAPRVAQVLVERIPGRPVWSAATDLTSLGFSGLGEFVPDVRQLVETDTRDEVRGAALEALARLGGSEAAALAREHLRSPSLGRQAAIALGLARTGTADRDTVLALTEAAIEADSAWVRGFFAEALLRVGGDAARRAAAGLLKCTMPATRQAIAWALAGIDVRRALTIARECGIVTDNGASDESLDRRKRPGTLADDAALFNAAMTERQIMLWFDAEGGYPPRHDRLLEDFAAATGGDLVIEAPMQRVIEGPEGTEPIHEVQFVSGERLYRFQARPTSDYYDVAAVRHAVHRALEDRGTVRRFVGAITGGQEAAYLYGPPDAIATMADRLYIEVKGRSKEYQEVLHRLIVSVADSSAQEQPGPDPAAGGLLRFDAFVPSHLDESVAAALGQAAAGGEDLAVTSQLMRGPVWSRIAIFMRPRAVALSGGVIDHIQTMLQAVCETLPVMLGRTCAEDLWSRLEEHEIVAGMDRADWAQYFGPPHALKLRPRRLRSSDLYRTAADARGGLWIWANEHPFANIEYTRDRIEKDIGALGRPRTARQEQLSAAQRAALARPSPATRPWDAGQAAAAREAFAAVAGNPFAVAAIMRDVDAWLDSKHHAADDPALAGTRDFFRLGLLAASACDGHARTLLATADALVRARDGAGVRALATGTLKAAAVWGHDLLGRVVRGAGDVARVTAFAHAYAAHPDDTVPLESLRLWDGFYGSDRDAVRLVVRALGDAAMEGRFVRLDNEALEGAVRLAAWSAGRPVAERAAVLEQLVHHAHTGQDDAAQILRFARGAPDRDVIGGMVALQAAMIRACECPRCAVLKHRLDGG